MALAPSALALVAAMFALRQAGDVGEVILGFGSLVLPVLGGILAVAGGVLRDGGLQARGLGLAGVGYFGPAVVLGIGEPLEMFFVLVLILAGTSIARSAWRYVQLAHAQVGGGAAMNAMLRSLRSYAGRMVAVAVLAFLASAAVLDFSLSTAYGFGETPTALLFGLAILAALAVLAMRGTPSPT